MTSRRFTGTIDRVNPASTAGLFLARVALEGPNSEYLRVVITHRTKGYFDLIRRDHFDVGDKVSGIFLTQALLALEVEPIILSDKPKRF